MMILEQAREKILARLQKENLLGKKISLKARVLSTQEAIGNPEEYDFPLLKGKEKIIEAQFEGYAGHAFTDMYGGYEGSLADVFQMELNNNYRRALMVASINALMHYWGEAADTIHCKDQQPKLCARECLKFVQAQYPRAACITLVGYQPALADAFRKALLSPKFPPPSTASGGACGEGSGRGILESPPPSLPHSGGGEHGKKYILKILDLDRDNIGQERFGTIVLNGNKDMEDALQWADLVLATGSTLVNGTIDRILNAAPKEKVIFYGVTIAGAAALLNLNRMCFPGES